MNKRHVRQDPEMLLARRQDRLADEPVRTQADAAVLVDDESLAPRRKVTGFFVGGFRDTGPFDTGLVRRIGAETAGRPHEPGTREAGPPPLPDHERVLPVAVNASDGLLRPPFQGREDGAPATIALGARALRAFFSPASQNRPDKYEPCSQTT